MVGWSELIPGRFTPGNITDLVWEFGWTQGPVCTELKKGALEGLCTYVSKGFFPVREGKVKECFIPTPPRYHRIGTGQCLSERLNCGKNTTAHLNVVVL